VVFSFSLKELVDNGWGYGNVIGVAQKIK